MFKMFAFYKEKGTLFVLVIISNFNKLRLFFGHIFQGFLKPKLGARFCETKARIEL